MTLTRLAAAFWTRSPQQLVATVRRRFLAGSKGAAAGHDAAEGYHASLVDEFYQFVAERYPADVLPRERFRALFDKYLDPAWLKASNRYIGDLWYLFAPDFQKRLDSYYAHQDFQLTMTLLSYGANAALLHANYIWPYEIARQRLERATVLELGAGIPHGFLFNARRGDGWCTQLISVDIAGMPAAFLQFFCRRHRISHRGITARAGMAPDLSGVRGVEFVFAKDVFEHLLDPDRAIDQLLAATAPRAVLALDLDDKGAVEYQHVSPTLQPLAARVEHAGFTRIDRTGNLTMFARD